MMEYNKEEAVRARGLAEKKMQNKDFVGAKKIATRAQQLHPDLENISQMLTVCDVHCSAENKMFGSDIDWYGILQIEQTADEALIKKQYRKLALLLHPDKNKFAGAEAAFKLIGEAQRVLSDKGKRSLYDMKRRGSLRTAAPKQPPHQTNRNSFVRKQPGVQNNFMNAATPQFTGSNPHQQQQQQTQPGISNGQQTFWTGCPRCGIRYQYYKNILNMPLRCPTCANIFTACDIDAKGAPAGANWSRSAFPQQKDGPQGTAGYPPSSMGFQGNFSRGTMASELFPKTRSTSAVGEGSKTKGKGYGDVGMEVGTEDGKGSKFEAKKPKEAKPSGNMSRKRARKSGEVEEEIEEDEEEEEESSESCDTGSISDTEEEVVFEEDGLPTGQGSGFTSDHYPRRSSRQKQNVTYNEAASDDDDFQIPPKRSRNESSNGAEAQTKEPSLEGEASKTIDTDGFAASFEEENNIEKQKGSDPLGQSLPNGNGKVEERKADEKKAALLDDEKESSKTDGDSESNSSSKSVPKPGLLDYPDPDFNDFDKDRTEDCFAGDQIWAVYDTEYGMPRFYARINKVCLPGFKLRITWLEPFPDKKDEIDWVKAELPVACGKFRHGESIYTEDRLMFSHLASWEKGSSRSSYKIYPKKGEIWALFKNWNIDWKSNPDNHKQHKFEFVEVMSDYSEEIGVNIVYLSKVKGFVSLFQPTIKKQMVSFQILPSELFRFSHRVPSFRMTGVEREDVPEGSFELDPASLPTDTEDFAHPEDVKADIESTNANIDSSCSISPGEKAKSKTESKRPTTPRKSTELEERGNSTRENGSLRESNGAHKKSSEANESQYAIKLDCLDGTSDSSHDGFVRSKASTSTFQVDDKERQAGDTNSDLKTEDPCSSPASSPEDYPIPETEFYNFEADKSQEKFGSGQIWALYSEEDCLPKYYAQIKKIESSQDFKLCITWLESCSLPKDMIQWSDKDMPICCGNFKLGAAKPVDYEIASFSHQLRAESTSRNRYDIYPREGEVWALYKNWNPKWKCSDLKNCKYDVVEVLEENGLVMKVLVLEKMEGFNAVFKAQRRGGSAVTMEIPRRELLRFSHQIPAFRLMEENNGNLRGCWELDPGSLPYNCFI